MHYHLVVIEDGEEKPIATFDRWPKAEEEADILSHLRDDWVAIRYPGRSWRPGEVAVYLDRRPLVRRVTNREVVVIRCEGVRCPSAQPEEAVAAPAGQQETGPMPIASPHNGSVGSDPRMSIFLEHSLALAIVLTAVVAATWVVGAKLGALETLLRAAQAVSQAPPI